MIFTLADWSLSFLSDHGRSMCALVQGKTSCCGTHKVLMEPEPAIPDMACYRSQATSSAAT